MTPPDSQGRKNSFLPESTIQKSRVLLDPVDASMVPSGANARNLTPSAYAGNAHSFRPVEASNKMMRLSGQLWPVLAVENRAQIQFPFAFTFFRSSNSLMYFSGSSRNARRQPEQQT